MDLTYACLALGLTFNEIKTLHWALQRPRFYYEALNHMFASEFEQYNVPSDSRIPRHLHNQPAFVHRKQSFLSSLFSMWPPTLVNWARCRKTFYWLEESTSTVCVRHLDIDIPDGSGWSYVGWEIHFPVIYPNGLACGNYPIGSQFLSTEALTTPAVVFQNVLQRLAE